MYIYVCMHYVYMYACTCEKRRGVGGGKRLIKRKGKTYDGGGGGGGEGFAYHHLQLQASCHPLLLQYHRLLVHTLPAAPSRQNNKQETLNGRWMKCCLVSSDVS